MKLNFLSLVEGRQFDRLIQARGDLLELLGDAVSMKLILAQPPTCQTPNVYRIDLFELELKRVLNEIRCLQFFVIIVYLFNPLALAALHSINICSVCIFIIYSQTALIHSFLRLTLKIKLFSTSPSFTLTGLLIVLVI